MKTSATLVLAAALLAPLVAQATPQSDMHKFQAYFRKRFPNVPFKDYANGVYAMPAAKNLRAQWKQIMEYPS